MKKEFSSRVNGDKIYVDQLKHGHVEKIEERFDPHFLEIDEEDLAFEDPIFVLGEAYVAESDLVLHLTVTTKAKIPCIICNEQVKVPLQLSKFYHTEPIEKIKSGIFSMLAPLREAILLEVPSFAECHDGKCPQRKEFEKYFKKTAPSENEGKDTYYHPFDGLKLD